MEHLYSKVYYMQLQEGCQKIIQLVKECENNGGITKNEVCRILIEEYGGSRSTYWKCFDLLLSPKSGNEIEAKIIPPNKQLEKLFPTEKNRKVEEFDFKLKTAEKLIRFLEKTPLIGDCYENSKNDKFLEPDTTIEAETIRKDSKKEIEIYTLQARHNILEKMPLFLINYINDKNNDFSEDAKQECMTIMTPLIIRCVSLLQKDYSESVYCSNQFIDNIDITTHIYFGKIEVEPEIVAEFLKILGRYYYLISTEFANRLKINSCNEQKIISHFASTFYPKTTLNYSEDSKKIHIDALSIYMTGRPPYHNIFQPEELQILDKIMDGLAGKIVKKYVMYSETDPIKIYDYYIRWILSLQIFSKLERRLVMMLAGWARDEKVEHLERFVD